MAKRQKKIDLEAALKERFDRWDDIYRNGTNDPFWPDGVNLRFVKNHILYYKSEMEKAMEDGEYPAIYYRDTPPNVESAYMARPEEIRENAKESFRFLNENQDLRYIRHKVLSVDQSFVAKTSAKSLLSSVQALSEAIEKDDLVAMRRYENKDRLLDAIHVCAEQLRGYVPPENSQITLFEMTEEEEPFDLRL